MMNQVRIAHVAAKAVGARLPSQRGRFFMESKARFLGHAVHPMLIAFPMGLLPTAVALDATHLLFDSPSSPRPGLWMTAAGVVSGVVAGIFGAIDFFAIPKGTRARRVGIAHGTGNLVALGLFAGSVVARWSEPDRVPKSALAMSLPALALMGAAGWLGGELVERLGVSVDPGANLDAPSSLSGQPAGGGKQARFNGLF